GACRLALATGSLPATGGHRPQILATIDHRELFPPHSRDPQSGQAAQSGQPSPSGPSSKVGQPALFNRPRQGSGTGSFTFTGPVPAATLRTLACDADIIPVVLGSEGQVLDIGRASRVFPPQIRKAITARDKGCAFPG
ncbi:HNH endonuclease, partial [Arthrobacter sp. 2RAF6]